MFGRYKDTFCHEDGDILIKTERKNGFLTYRRRCRDETFERLLASETGEFIINPVEPVNLPKSITDFFQIDFPPMVIEPGLTRTIYLEFPVEIGVFLNTAKDIEVLDIFGLGTQKYTLYGPPTSGVIARWYRSAVHMEIPPVDRLSIGVMKLTIQNAATEWAEVARVVFNSLDMKIYYGDIVAATATMKIVAPSRAETNFTDAPLIPGMTRSVELNKTHKIPVISHGYLMEWGLS
ncbi:MAG: DUF432 domain-containing protein [Methanomicrobiales archaeon]|nr:DUF432 domain-containing protein [Methanomicrobiales archaeon]